MKDSFSNWKGMRSGKRRFPLPLLTKKQTAAAAPAGKPSSKKCTADGDTNLDSKRPPLDSKAAAKSLSILSPRQLLSSKFRLSSNTESSKDTKNSILPEDEPSKMVAPISQERKSVVYSTEETSDIDRETEKTENEIRNCSDNGGEEESTERESSISFETNKNQVAENNILIEEDNDDNNGEEEEEEFFLPNGFIGKFRSDTEPLFSKVQSLLSAIKEEEDDNTMTTQDEEEIVQSVREQSLESETFDVPNTNYGVDNQNSEQDDARSTKYVTLLHKNVAYETKSTERNVEVAMDRENPIGAALKISLQREQSMENSSKWEEVFPAPQQESTVDENSKTYEEKSKNRLSTSFPTSESHLKKPLPKQNSGDTEIVAQEEAKDRARNASEQNDVIERDTAENFERLFDDTLSSTAVNGVGGDDPITNFSSFSNDTDLTENVEGMASQLNVEGLLQSSSEKSVVDSDLVDGPKEWLHEKLLDRSVLADPKNVPNQNEKEVTRPMSEVTANKFGVLSESDERLGKYSVLNTPEKVDETKINREPGPCEEIEVSMTDASKASTSGTSKSSDMFDGDASLASDRTAALMKRIKVLQTYVDEDKDTLWVAIKLSPSLDMAKLEKSLAKTISKGSKQKKKKRSRWSGEKGLLPWRRRKNSSASTEKATLNEKGKATEDDIPTKMTTIEIKSGSLEAFFGNYPVETCLDYPIDDYVTFLSTIGGDCSSPTCRDTLDTVVEEEGEDSPYPTRLLAIKDMSKHQLSAELQSNAVQWSRQLEDLLNLEAEKVVSRAEGLASKAVQISTQTLATISSMFVSSECSKEPSNFMDQMKLGMNRLVGRKNGFAIDWLGGGDQSACPMDLLQGDTGCSEPFWIHRNAFDQCVNEEIEIVYHDQEESLNIPLTTKEPIVLAAENIIRTFVCTGKPSNEEVEDFREDASIQSNHEKRSSSSGHTMEETRDDIVSPDRGFANAEEFSSETQSSGNTGKSYSAHKFLDTFEGEQALIGTSSHKPPSVMEHSKVATVCAD